MINKLKHMAKLALRKFKPTPEEVQLTGVAPMTQEEILEQLKAYKAQNPVKYEAKKAALFARYGFTIEDVPAPVKDESDVELEALEKKVKKAK